MATIIPIRKTLAMSRDALETERARLLAEADALSGREQGFGTAMSEGAENSSGDGFILAADGAGGHAADVATDLFEHELALGLNQKIRERVQQGADRLLSRVKDQLLLLELVPGGLERYAILQGQGRQGGEGVHQA